MLQKNALRWLTAQGSKSNSVWFVRTPSYGTYGTRQAPLGFMNCSFALLGSCLELQMEWQVPIMMITRLKIWRIKNVKILWMMPHFRLQALFLICAKLPYEYRLGGEKAYLSNWTDSKGMCLLYEEKGLFHLGLPTLASNVQKGTIVALSLRKVFLAHSKTVMKFMLTISKCRKRRIRLVCILHWS